MKSLFAFLLIVSSAQVFAGAPHAFDVPAKLLADPLVVAEIAKYPNYYFNTLIFEESDDNWTEHTFSLVLSKYDEKQSGPTRLCFWVDYNEKINKPVTRITPNKTSCDQ